MVYLDPGNLGTIIRVADWYGIKHIVARSSDCADLTTLKTISATMGSFGRVHVSQTDLPAYLEQGVFFTSKVTCQFTARF